jgi:branched-chain amino acid transport system ATP-binding protein
MSALLQVEELVAGYQGRPVLQGISLTVPAGSVVGLIGPNGHGKTTLLRVVSGLLAPMAGRIVFDGAPIAGRRADEIVGRGLVQVPQGDLLFPEMTVLENLQMGGYLAPPAALGRRLEEVFQLFPKLAERRRQLASTLSGGERRMVGIGRGLMAGGRLLMLDEPSLGLAPIIIEQIYAAIRQLVAAGSTVLIVEENATRLADLAQELHLLDSGRFVWRGDGQALLRSPEILASYLGA